MSHIISFLVCFCFYSCSILGTHFGNEEIVSLFVFSLLVTSGGGGIKT